MKQAKVSPTVQRYVHAYTSGNKELKSFAAAVENAILKNKSNGNPIARYDAARKKPYMEYPDGRRVYADEG